ncbi:hypothetical protein [Parabacteroides bouchesdurhonensis]|uniref:hypothetical protein n=1 Tax=Parabacteroides bouchesdurhonensis TaxID=1936995 RepID=UPI0018FE9865|nr:hypothetical protein [Parabacteroides bouchesdurhonensis]
MTTKDIKLQEEEELKAMEDKYPVEQVATEGCCGKVTEKEVKDAVKELNPDKNSLGSRG